MSIENRLHSQGGFTLIETIVSLIIGAFILSGVMFTYVSMKLTTKDTLEIGELQEAGRLAMDILRKDIAQSGFWGSHGFQILHLSDTQPYDVPSAPSNDCSQGINNASFPSGVGNFHSIFGIEATSTSALGCITTAVTNSDIIQLKGAAGNNFHDGAGTGTASGTLAGNYYLQVEQESGLIRAGGGTIAVTDVESVWKYNHHVYFIENQTYTKNGRSISIPVLMRMRLTATAGMASETIMEGIENIRFIYGVDTVGDSRVDTYKSSDQMTADDWNEPGTILTVQVFLLVRSLEPDLDKKVVSRTYTLGGDSSETKRNLTFSDQYRRTMMVSTVKINSSGKDIWQ